MSQLFNRSCRARVQAGSETTLLEGFRMSFDVQKTSKKTLNQLTLTVYNLSEETRKKVSQGETVVELVAGYEPSPEVIFSGDVLLVTHTKVGTEWQTKFVSTDGLRKKQTSRVSKSFAPGTNVKDVIAELAKSTGFDLGNVIDEVKKGNIKKGIESFVNGFVSAGSATDEFDKVLKSYGYNWSVQDGAIQVMAPGEFVGNDVVVLNASSGLIGSPEVENDAKLKCKALIQQRFVPGRAVKLESLAFDGVYRIEETKYVGDTHGNDWYAEMTLELL